VEREGQKIRQYSRYFRAYLRLARIVGLLKASGLISRPILRLEDTMRMVSTNKNYGVRAVKSYDDEIGRLIDGFNTMLSEIQQRDIALQSTNGELKTRTARAGARNIST